MSVCLPRVEPTEVGDYKLCFDNSFSTISEKLVFFELIFDSLQDDEEVEGWAEAVEPEEMLDVKMEDIKVHPGWTGAIPPTSLALTAVCPCPPTLSGVLLGLTQTPPVVMLPTLLTVVTQQLKIAHFKV